MQDRLFIDHFDAIARRYAASTATLGAFPGLLLIPAALHPTRFALFRAVKPGG